MARLNLFRAWSSQTHFVLLGGSLMPSQREQGELLCKGNSAGAERSMRIKSRFFKRAERRRPRLKEMLGGTIVRRERRSAAGSHAPLAQLEFHCGEARKRVGQGGGLLFAKPLG